MMNSAATSSDKASVGVLLSATVGFCALLAVKDLLFRVLALEGMSSGQILFIVGLACGITSISVAVLTRGQIELKNKKLQLVRFFVAGLSGYFIAEAFHVLNASSVAMVSKIYIPLLLLVSPLIGVSYTARQKVLAAASIGAIVIFILCTHQPEMPIAGYGYAIIAALLVMVEYITLRRTALSEKLFWTAATPAMSCLVYGLLTAGPTNVIQILDMPIATIAIAFLAGVILYLVYAVSIHRYRILPLGISEYPSLVTALVLLPLELLIYGGHPESSYILCLVSTTFLMGLTIYFRDHDQLLNPARATA
jgi:hypothetical protein